MSWNERERKEKAGKERVERTVLASTGVGRLQETKVYPIVSLRCLFAILCIFSMYKMINFKGLCTYLVLFVINFECFENGTASGRELFLNQMHVLLHDGFESLG